MKRLINSNFDIVLDEKKGFIAGIKHPAQHHVSNFILPFEQFADVGIPDRERLGSVRLGYRFKNLIDWQFFETGFSEGAFRTSQSNKNGVMSSSFQYDLNSKSSPFSIIEKYTLDSEKDFFKWEISIKNKTDSEIEMGEISLPIPFNSAVRDLKVEEMYSQRVIIHPFIAGHSSYILIQRLDGIPPYLLMVPDDNTPIECIAQTDSGEFEGLRLAGGGIKRIYVYSLASKESLGWKRWFHGHSGRILNGEGNLKTGFVFRWVNSFEEIGDVLYDLGKVAFRVTPGMVIPRGVKANVLIRTRKKIRKISSSDGSILKKADGIYEIAFRMSGLKRIEIQYGKDEWTALVFNSIPQLETLIKKRADFIVKNQQVNDKKNERYGAFMMWDSEEKAMVFKAPAPYFYGCSDELGFADPLFLSIKNTRYPNEKEIAALERYIDEFLFGKIQDKKTYGISLWYGNETWRHYRGSDTVRSFNYPHVFNIYYCMYLTGKYYALTKTRSPIQYLKMSYKTAIAFYSLKMIAGDSYTTGNMGASMLLKILCALEEEGMRKEHDKLKSFMLKSATYFSKTMYPYGSEFSYDTTGLESVYFFRKYIAKKPDKAEDTLRCALALRHRHPLWCQSGNDVRCGMGNGKYGERSRDEICFSYMAPLNGWAILDAFEEKNDPLLIETGYAGILGCWSLVEPDGTGHNLYTHEPEAMLYDAWTSEMGLALFASFQSMASYIVDDGDFGITGYGCDIKYLDERIVISPKDWANSKLIDAIDRISIMAPNGIIEQAVINKNKRLDVIVKPVLKGQKNIYVKIWHHEKKRIAIKHNGGYQKFLKGKAEFFLTSEKNPFTVEVL